MKTAEMQQIEKATKAAKSEASHEQETISDQSDEEVFSVISTTEKEIEATTSSAEENETQFSEWGGKGEGRGRGYVQFLCAWEKIG